MNDKPHMAGSNPPIQTPIDPNNDMSDTTDVYGMTGMTQNFLPNQSSQQPSAQDSSEPTPNTMSTEMLKRAEDVASETDQEDEFPLQSEIDSPRPFDSRQNGQFSDDSPNLDQPSGPNSNAPSVQGELSVSGDMPDPESDDDTLANAQAMGFQVDEDSENPKPLNMAADFDKGEAKAHE